jgi:hypothetical protein
MVICSQNHTKYISAIFGQNITFLNVQPVGSYSYRLAEKGKMRTAFIFKNFLFSIVSSELHNQIFLIGLYP